MEVVHSVAANRQPTGSDPNEIVVYLIAQNDEDTRGLLFESLARLDEGGCRLLDPNEKPLATKEDPKPVRTWNRSRFREIQERHRADPEGDPAFELSRVLPEPSS